MATPRTPNPQKNLLDLRLFVAGSGSRSLRSIENVKRACEKHAPGGYSLSIVDIYVQPEEAAKCQVVAVPTLIREFPAPVRMYIGEISSPSELNGPFSWLPGSR
jgi:circadian clock protein KaiB